jgi:hypothetical protein
MVECRFTEGLPAVGGAGVSQVKGRIGRLSTRRREMSSVSPSIPATVKRGRLFGLVVGIAALTAAVTWAISAYAFDNGGSSATGAVPADVIGNPLPLLPQATISSAAPVVGSYFPTPQHLAQVGGGYTVGGGQTQDVRRHPSIMSLTAADLAANALGTGYALPSAQKGPSVESVLAAMSPQTREYTKPIMNLTFAQLAAGAAGSP